MFRPGSGRFHSGVDPLLPAHSLPLSFRSQRGALFASRTISREISPSPLFLSLSFRAQRGIPQPPFHLAFLIAFAAVHSPTRNGEPSIAKNVFRLHPRREVGRPVHRDYQPSPAPRLRTQRKENARVHTEIQRYQARMIRTVRSCSKCHRPREANQVMETIKEDRAN